MKQFIYNNLRVLTGIFFISCSTLGIAQEKTALEILKETQNIMKSSSDMSCDMSYNWYDTYADTNPSLSYKGRTIKHDKVVYTKINQTFFLIDQKTQLAIKCNETQKALLVTKVNDDYNQSPWELLESYIQQFKVKKVSDQGNHWVCTLTTDVITQLPYGKIEIYIDKQSSMMTKQVLYFLSQVPYTSADGEKKIGNPKLEVALSDFKTVLSQEEKRMTQLTSYIHKKGEKITPTIAYKAFRIIQD
ncbi:hypothetical protein [Kordia zhangzhouensis]|uniref:hypothetical protein n=1 Tax=Kordia zhangzhouensis TaxID=1620405 RepID=UPI00062932E9|nr:hypothetical protein [Kordia zhangzhouensis]